MVRLPSIRASHDGSGRVDLQADEPGWAVTIGGHAPIWVPAERPPGGTAPLPAWQPCPTRAPTPTFTALPPAFWIGADGDHGPVRLRSHEISDNREGGRDRDTITVLLDRPRDPRASLSLFPIVWTRLDRVHAGTLPDPLGCHRAVGDDFIVEVDGGAVSVRSRTVAAYLVAVKTVRGWATPRMVVSDAGHLVSQCGYGQDAVTGHPIVQAGAPLVVHAIGFRTGPATAKPTP